VNFTSVVIGSQFQAEGTQFLDIKKGTHFDYMKVLEGAFFRAAVFAGPVVLTNGRFVRLSIEGVKNSQRKSTIGKLDLTETVIKRELRIANTVVGRLDAGWLRVDGALVLDHVAIEDYADLRSSNLSSVDFLDVCWPKPPHTIALGGISYERISAGRQSGGDQRLIDLVERANYSMDVYAGLEEFFRRKGDFRLADATYIAMKRRQRKEILGGVARGWNFFYDESVAYGREFWRLWCYVLIVLALSWFTYRRECRMVRRTEGKESRYKPVYSPFWYSVDLLMPFDLGVERYWAPSEDRWKARHAVYVFKLLGWLLIVFLGYAVIKGEVK